LVVETETGKVRAYIGSHNFHDTLNAGQVDGVQSVRSTGSLLKPFLVAAAIDEGPFCMESQLHDVPTFYGSFRPQNASKEFYGLVTMREMLVRSLNVPAVRLLHYYGLDRFYGYLKENAGLTSLFRSPRGYGLSLILGGAEASLWELTRMYVSLGNKGKQIRFTINENDSTPLYASTNMCSPGASFLVTETLSELQRPGAEYYWHRFSNQIPVAWKTGTSYGQKDGWAIGTNKQWTIGVWVGNFNGEGNPELGGAKTAGPVLFELFNELCDRSKSLWFTKPEYDLRPVTLCKESGYLPNAYCPDTIRTVRPSKAYRNRLCPYHKRFLIDEESGYRVCSRCWQGADTSWVVQAIYPPSVESILRDRGIAALSPPQHNPQCPAIHLEQSVEIIYPTNGITIFLPRNAPGQYEKLVCIAKHHRTDAHLFWYINDELVGETERDHSLAVDLPEGTYRLVVQDEEGVSSAAAFKVFRKESD
jgi:penicillin-binding protein 1C